MTPEQKLAIAHYAAFTEKMRRLFPNCYVDITISSINPAQFNTMLRLNGEDLDKGTICTGTDSGDIEFTSRAHIKSKEGVLPFD